MEKLNSYYLNEMKKIPLLSLEEEKALAAKAFKGDKAAQNKLVEHNLRFVIKVAGKYMGYMDFEDLVAEGTLGLMHAAEKFNPANNNKFITYAQWWIRCYIQKAIRDTATGVKFPASKFEDMKKPEWRFASLDKVIGSDDDGETTLASFIEDDRFGDLADELWVKDSMERLGEVLTTLSQKEQDVLVLRFGLDGNEPMSLSEAGEIMGYSKERIRQIEKKALLELRNKIDCTNNYAGLAA